jgi:hypothetical protein
MAPGALLSSCFHWNQTVKHHQTSAPPLEKEKITKTLVDENSCGKPEKLRSASAAVSRLEWCGKG